MGKKTQFFIKIFMILLGSVIMAVNINTLTNSGGLLPGGFTGVTLLLQEIILNKFGGNVNEQNVNKAFILENLCFVQKHSS